MASSDVASIFRLDPARGSFISSFGPKGSGKSELITRFFSSYPYNGLMMDFTGDLDPRHEFTIPLTPRLHQLARELGEMREPSLGSFDRFRSELRDAWTDGGRYRFAKYRLEPSFLSDDWLKRTDDYVGLAYMTGHCFVFFDEIGEEAPVGRTPRWTRQSLRVGRHEQLSLGMAGPRPADLDPNVLNQADIVTIHGQLHELDVARMARQLHLKQDQLSSLMSELTVEERDGVELHSFIAYVKKTREIFLLPPLPPRPAPRPAVKLA